MSKNQYNAPAVEVVEFGKEDIVCVISGTSGTDWKGDGVDHPDFGGGWDGSSQPEG